MGARTADSKRVSIGVVPALATRLESYVRLSGDDRAALARLNTVSRVVQARRDLLREGEKPRYVHLMFEALAERA